MLHTANEINFLEYSEEQKRERVAHLLSRELACALDLNDHLKLAVNALDGRAHSNISNLLRSLLGQLMTHELLLIQRLEILAPGSGNVHDHSQGHQKFWVLYPEENRDCRAHLEALVAGYAGFMRSTSEIATTVKRFADVDSLQLLKDCEAVGNRGLWFLEIYLEGLAVGMDSSRLPRCPESIGAAH